MRQNRRDRDAKVCLTFEVGASRSLQVPFQEGGIDLGIPITS
jgi:hypothetical protein